MVLLISFLLCLVLILLFLYTFSYRLHYELINFYITYIRFFFPYLGVLDLLIFITYVFFPYCYVDVRFWFLIHKKPNINILYEEMNKKKDEEINKEMNYLIFKSLLHLTKGENQVYISISEYPAYMYNIFNDFPKKKKKKKKPLRFRVKNNINTLELQNVALICKLYNSYFSNKSRKSNLFVLLILVCSNIDLVIYNALINLFIFEFLLKKSEVVNDLYCISELKVIHSFIIKILYNYGIFKEKNNPFFIHYFYHYYKLLKSHTETEAILLYLSNDLSCFPLVTSFDCGDYKIVRITKNQLKKNNVVRCIRFLLLVNKLNPSYLNTYFFLLIREVSVKFSSSHKIINLFIF